MRCTLATVCSTLLLANGALAWTNPAIRHFQRHEKKSLEQRIVPKHAEAPIVEKRKSSPYLNSKSKKFWVNGTNIPDVDFDIGESYAGLLPISDDPHETRKLFFWFFPSANPAAKDEVTIWFNGGPGCSSLSGLLTENGPFTWQAGTYAPTQNPYTWVNLTNMLWVEQPVGVGFSQGTPNIRNEVELGKQFIGFYKNFVNTFNLKGRKTYITGESYAGYYVPYVADAFINAKDKEYYNLAGVAINDPIIGDGNLQEEVVVSPYVDYWSNLFYLNQTTIDYVHKQHEQCGYAEYFDKYFKFPPPQKPFPTVPDPFATNDTSYPCDLFDYVYSAVLEVNPCFNIYHITETCPHPLTVLGIVNPGDYTPPGLEVYFNRTDVQKAINAPVGTDWQQCTDKNVFNYGYVNNYTLDDTSPGPAINGVLQRVIEYTNNTIIGNGNLDFLLNTNGTLFAIQNMTWHGLQGLQKYPSTPLYVPYHTEYNGGFLAESGEVGYWGAERGLTFYQVQLAGHELPGYTPGAAYRVVELLLGRIKNLSEVSPFTTQRGSTGSAGSYGGAAARKKGGKPILPAQGYHG